MRNHILRKCEHKIEVIMLQCERSGCICLHLDLRKAFDSTKMLKHESIWPKPIRSKREAKDSRS